MMKSKSNYHNINNLHSLIQFLYYLSIVSATIALISTFAISFVPNSHILFENGIREWIYSVDIPLGIGTAAFIIHGSISQHILQELPIFMINIRAAITIDYLVSVCCPCLLSIIGLKKMLCLTTDILNKESPFQLKHAKSLRKFSYLILIYSTLGNTLLCVLNSIFVIDFFYITVDFSWIGILTGITGYIFSDITEYGLFLQDEYDMTL